MKIREGGMPNEELWSSFFDPEAILDALGFQGIETAVDLGCGYGTFTIPAARLVSGIIYGFDIEADMIAECNRKAAVSGVNNVICRQRDFITQGTGLAAASAGYVMLFNMLHADEPLGLLQEAHRILAPGGKLGVIHWNYDPGTPRGPSMAIRPRPEQCQEWIKVVGFELLKPHIDLPPYHYGILGRKY